MGRPAAALLVSVLFALCPAWAADDDAADRLCRFLTADVREERDDLELEFDLSRSELDAAEQIYGMVESLWKEDAIERIVFLLARHDREAARLEVERSRLQLERQEAIVDQYRYFCLLLEDGRSDEHRAGLDAAFERYRETQCGVLERDLAIAAVDLEYLREFLKSILELREGDVATRQDVIRAERDVEMAQKRVESGKGRVTACRDGS